MTLAADVELTVDQGYAELNKQIPWALPLVSSWLHHGLIVTDQKALALFFGACGFDNVTLAPKLSEKTVRGLSERDLCVAQNPSVEFAAELSRSTCAGLFWVDCPDNLPKGLADATISFADLQGSQTLLQKTLADLSRVRWHYTKTSRTNRPAVFMDRDGTIIEFIDYLDDPSGVRLRPEAIDVIRAAHKKGWAVVCVTNQSGLGRARYDWNSYIGVQKRMLQLLAEQGVYLDACMEAPYFSGAESAKWHAHPSLRKPRSGMLLSAARRWGYQVSRSIMVGDSLVDLQAGTTAGVAHVIYVGEQEQDLSAYQEWLKNFPEPHPKLHCDPKMKDIAGLLTS